MTNANNTRTASHLLTAFEDKNLVNRFLSLTIRQKGTLMGKKDAKIRVNDDLKLHVGIVGADYGRLVERSRSQLAVLQSDPAFAANLAAELKVDVSVVNDAITEVADSLALSAAGQNESTSADAFEPLVVDGVTIPGCKVYVGKKNADGDDTATLNEDAEKIGTIYVDMLSVYSKTLEEAKHTHTPNSAPLTLAKNAIRYMLPIGRYRRFSLAVDGDKRPIGWQMKIGNEAVLHAEGNGAKFGEIEVDTFLLG